jgi:hypothetical protein
MCKRLSEKTAAAAEQGGNSRRGAFRIWRHRHCLIKGCTATSLTTALLSQENVYIHCLVITSVKILQAF